MEDNAPEATKGAARRAAPVLPADATPRRPVLLMVASVLLAVLAAWTGVNWKRASDQEGKLRAELRQVYLEAEQLRAQAAQSEQRVALLEKQVMALSAEREATTKRIEELEAELARARGRRPAPRPAR
jgi:septal ring factor EnvC (AmiA/AmiB activator)